jgi:hypothetical protein
MARYVEALERYRGGGLAGWRQRSCQVSASGIFRRLRDRYEAEGAEGLSTGGAGAPWGGACQSIAVEQDWIRYWDTRVTARRQFHEALQAAHGVSLGHTLAHRKERPRRPLTGIMLF